MQMLKGKQFNNTIRINMYVAEAITRIKINAFEDLLGLMNKYHIYEDIMEMNEMVELKKSPSPESLNNCFQLIQPLLELCQEYDVLLSDQSYYPNANFWNSYLRMVQTLILLELASSCLRKDVSLLSCIW